MGASSKLTTRQAGAAPILLSAAAAIARRTQDMQPTTTGADEP